MHPAVLFPPFILVWSVSPPVTLDHNGDEHSRLSFLSVVSCFILPCSAVAAAARALSHMRVLRPAAVLLLVRFPGPTSELFLPIFLHKLLCCCRLMIACCFKLPCCLWCARLVYSKERNTLEPISPHKLQRCLLSQVRVLRPAAVLSP